MSRQLRSGSLSSSGDITSGLVRKGSGREGVRTEEVVVEDQDLEDGEGVGTGMENENFAKGLSRQSSLPSRRCKSLYSSINDSTKIGMTLIPQPSSK